MLQLIDANALGHAYHRATVLTVNGLQVQAIFGFVREMRKLRLASPASDILVLWDGYAQHRFALLPDYKGDRARKEQEDPTEGAVRAAYRAQVPIIKAALHMLGVRQMVHPDLEADDLAGALCAVAKGVRKRLVTGDTDWLQLVDEQTDWYDCRYDGKLITHQTFHQSTGYFTPDQYLQGKALQGDTTDSIPGIPGIAEKTAAVLIATWKGVQPFFNAVDDGSYTPKVRKSKTAVSLHPEQVLASPAGREVFRRNMALMDLRTPAPGMGAGIQMTSGPVNLESFQTLAARLNFASVTRDYAGWMLPFTQQQQQLPLAA